MKQETVQPERAASQEEENRDHDIYRKGFGDGQTRARSEVLASIHAWYDRLFYAWKNGHEDVLALLLKQGPKPAVTDLEELLEQAHEAGAVIAGEQLLKSLTEGGEFAVGSPLAKAKNRVKELLREAELKGRIQALRAVDRCCNEFESLQVVAETVSEGLHNLERQVAELEKARASEGKG